MAYTVINKNETGGCDIRSFRFLSLEEAQERFLELKKLFESECDDSGFLDCISVQSDTPTHYEATDGEDWVDIRILQEI